MHSEDEGVAKSLLQSTCVSFLKLDSKNKGLEEDQAYSVEDTKL